MRHIIDKKSPIFGHTMESLKDGDASFSLTIMGLERTSMQPIFHLEVRDKLMLLRVWSFSVLITFGTPYALGNLLHCLTVSSV